MKYSNNDIDMATDFFYQKVNRINVMLKGNLSDRHREVLKEKRTFYEIALESIKQEFSHGR